MQSGKYTVTSKPMLDQVYRDALRGIEDHGFIKLQWKAGSARSINQNDLYWLWLGEIATQTNEKTGKDFVKDEIHLWMVNQFLGHESTWVGKTEIHHLVSTTSLSKGEMYHYMSQIEAWAFDNGFVITIPEDSEYRKQKLQTDGM